MRSDGSTSVNCGQAGSRPSITGSAHVCLETDGIRDVPDRHPRIGSARSLRLKNSSQKKPSQYRDTALTRLTFRNECTEANFGARIRYSDNVSGPLPTSTVVLPHCVHRPVHQVGISMPRDATDRPLRVSRSSSREKFLNNCAVLGSATKMRQTRPPFR